MAQATVWSLVSIAISSEIRITLNHHILYRCRLLWQEKRTYNCTKTRQVVMKAIYRSNKIALVGKSHRFRFGSVFQFRVTDSNELASRLLSPFFICTSCKGWWGCAGSETAVREAPNLKKKPVNTLVKIKTKSGEFQIII